MNPPLVIGMGGSWVILHRDGEPRIETVPQGRSLPYRRIHLVCQDGVYEVSRPSPFEQCCRRATVAGAPRVAPGSRLALPAVPASLLMVSLAFHISIARRLGSESMTLIYYDLESGRYRLGCPEQWVPPLGAGRAQSVEYQVDPATSLSEYRVGSIHSHPVWFGSRPSAVDLADTEYFPGVHFIFSGLHSTSPQLGVYTVVDREADLDAPLSRWVQGDLPATIRSADLPQFPEEWPGRVKERVAQGGHAQQTTRHPGLVNGQPDGPHTGRNDPAPASGKGRRKGEGSHDR